MNNNIWFYNLLNKIVKFFTLTIPSELKLYYNIIKYRGRKNIPIEELLIFTEEEHKALRVLADMVDLCDRLKIDYKDTYIGRLILNSINSTFENMEDFQTSIDLYESDNHRLYMYNLLIKHNDIQKNRAVTIMNFDTYEEFMKWLYMKDDENDEVINKPV